MKRGLILKSIHLYIANVTVGVSVGFLMSVMTVSESSGPVDVAIGLVNGRLATDVVLRVDATGDLAGLNYNNYS